MLVGAATLLAREHGVHAASHVRDKLVEMAHLTETIHGLGLGASAKATRHGSGVWQVDPVLANVCKHNVTRLPYEVVRLAEDLAGGLLGTMPSLADLEHPELGAALQTFFAQRRALITAVLDAAVARGEIDVAVINDDLWDVLPGYLVFRHLLPRTPPSDQTVIDLVDQVMLPSLTRRAV